MNEQFKTVSQKIDEKAKTLRDGDAAAIFMSVSRTVKAIEVALNSVSTMPSLEDEEKQAIMSAVGIAMICTILHSKMKAEMDIIHVHLDRLTKEKD